MQMFSQVSVGFFFFLGVFPRLYNAVAGSHILLTESQPCFSFVHPNVEHPAYPKGAVIHGAKLINKVKITLNQNETCLFHFHLIFNYLVGSGQH